MQANTLARLLTKARILLKADASEAGEGWSGQPDCGGSGYQHIDTVARTRQQLVEEGFEAVLVRKHSPASARPRIFDGAAEAKLIALACSRPPKGRKRWTLQLLEEAVVELNIVERASDNTIGRTPKKTCSNLTYKDNGSSHRMPMRRSIANMEDVLEVFIIGRTIQSTPVVCLDETSKQLISETRVPIKVKPGQPARHDYEYEPGNGTANLFMMFAPLEGWRHVAAVTDRHTAVDFAHILKDLSDTHFPAAKRIYCSPWRTTSTPTNQRHSTKHSPQPKPVASSSGSSGTTRRNTAVGSKNMAEAELSVLSGQCLDRRIPDTLNLIEEVAAWEDTRNRKHVRADWQSHHRRRPREAEAIVPRTMNDSGALAEDRRYRHCIPVLIGMENRRIELRVRRGCHCDGGRKQWASCCSVASNDCLGSGAQAGG